MNAKSNETPDNFYPSLERIESNTSDTSIWPKSRRRGANTRRKKPAVFVCDNCANTFTTRFRRQSTWLLNISTTTFWFKKRSFQRILIGITRRRSIKYGTNARHVPTTLHFQQISLGIYDHVVRSLHWLLCKEKAKSTSILRSVLGRYKKSMML